VVGDEQEILVAHAADRPVPQAGLERHHVPGDERLPAGLAQPGGLVDPQPDPVSERELKALPGLLTRSVRRVAYPSASKRSRVAPCSSAPLTPGRTAARAG